ncbi:MAG TPA: hypothetical protein VLW47_03000, partial [Thermodesulfobacteriota bacterium]|nr:hypothetical protein [Thermodesulfobacteriota bacterium]
MKVGTTRNRGEGRNAECGIELKLMNSQKGVIPVKNGNPIEVLDVLARYSSLRLPSVALLEFTPYLIRGRNDGQKT